MGERVLTIGELQAWIDTNATALDATTRLRPAGSDLPQELLDSLPTHQQIRQLLGRRLVRAGQHIKAISYLSGMEGDVKALRQALATGRDPKKPARERALGLWRAAVLTREKGMELMGMEGEPDWSVWAGAFDVGKQFAERRLDTGIAAARPEEIARAASSAAVPAKRFHYRNLAADLALEASNLLPEGDEQGAAMLCWAGHWLYLREGVSQYYQVFRKRFGKSKFAGNYPVQCPEQP